MSEIKIINKDILDVIDYLDKDFDIVFTSPPYNLGSNYWPTEHRKNGLAKNEKWIKYINYKDNSPSWKTWLKEIIIKLLDHAEFVFLNLASFANNKIDIIELNYELKEYYCDCIVWNKNNGIPCGCHDRIMTNVYENIFIYSKHPRGRMVGTKKWNGTVSNLVSISSYNRHNFVKEHKAVMPLDLALWVLSNFVKDNGKVLDCFMGLGTTLLACQYLGLDAVGVEIDSKYCEMSKERLNKAKITR